MASFLDGLQKEALSKDESRLSERQRRESGESNQGPLVNTQTTAKKTTKSSNIPQKNFEPKNKVDQHQQRNAVERNTMRQYRHAEPARVNRQTKRGQPKTRVMTCLLYVEFPKVVHGIDLEGHLQQRINLGPCFKCKEVPLFDNSHRTVLQLEFPSKNSAKSAAKAIKNSNRLKNNINLKCAFSKDQLEKTELNKEELNALLLRLKCELSDKTEDQICLHDLKILEAENQLKALKIKNIPVHELGKVEEERKTLKQKIDELQQQQDEFRVMVDEKILSQLSEVAINVNKQHKLYEIRLQLGIEMSRLSKAFPIYARRTEIINCVLNNPVCIVLGETGSGKSTQMPQYLLEAGLANTGLIACTQPRKIAATSLATHVSSELVSNVGKTVGYKAGLRDKTCQSTKIVYLTDHSLLNEMLVDPILTKYSCVIVDEAHKRSIYTDLLLGMIKQCLTVRPEFKVIITSATIDTDIFYRYFGGCPVIKVPGRTFPVEVVWQEQEMLTPKENYLQAAVNVVADIHEIEPEGDVLVFVTSPLETEKCCQYLEQKLHGKTNFKCMQIHGKLQADEQQAVFSPLSQNKRKIVFATNSAETSVTIPGIKYVVDTGFVKEMRYDARKGLSSLDTVVISKSSAEQRKGRAGRMSSGKCFRLYTEEDFGKMEKATLPEILRIQLSQALLKLLDLGVNPINFDFVESPSKASITQAMSSLEELNAITGGQITELGKQLAVLPFEPRLGKMLLTGIDSGIPYEAIAMAALTTMGSAVFYRAGTDAEKAKSDLLKTRFCHPEGDHLTLLNVYQEWFKTPEKNKSKWCVSNSINGRCMKTVRETCNEVIMTLKKQMKIDVEIAFIPDDITQTKLKDVIFQSSMQNIAFYLGHPKAGYIVPGRDQQAKIHPSSSVTVLGGVNSEWIIFEQLINTSQDFLTIVSPIGQSNIYNAFYRGQLKFNPRYVEASTVKPVLVKNMGNSLFSAFVGTRFSNVKVVEEELTANQRAKIFCVDANRSRLQVTVHSNTISPSLVVDVINKQLLNVLEDLRFGDKEIPLCKKSANIRAVLEIGGVVRTLLFSGEYRSVYIEDISLKTEVQLVKEFLEEFGTVTECTPVKRKLESKPTRWGIATFKDTASATEAVRQRKESKAAKILPCVPSGGNVKPNEFTLSLSWTRRPLRGFGFIKCHNPEDMVMLLQYRVIEVCGNRAYLKLNKDASSVFISGLPETATEDLVKEAVEATLTRACVESVNLIRQNVELSGSELMVIKSKLSSLLLDILPVQKFTLDVIDPKPKTFFYKAFVRFPDPNEGVQAFNRIKGFLSIDGRMVDVQQDLSSKIFVPKYLLPVLEAELEKLTKENQKRVLAEKFSIVSRKSQAGHLYITIKSESTETMADVKKSYDCVINGRSPDLLQYGSEANALFRKESREKLDSIEKSTNTIICADHRFLQINVVGSQENCEKAFRLIDEYMRLLKTFPMINLELKGDAQPHGLMKKLLACYGIDLVDLRAQANLESVQLNFRRQILKLVGTNESLKKAESLIQECVKQLRSKCKVSVQKPTDDDIDCVVCLCPIEDGQLYRLNLCGHAYCFDCVKLQVKTTVSNRDLPFKCALEGCEECWCLRDIEENLSLAGHNLQDLVKASMDCFISQHPTQYHFCLTPDCPVVYPVSVDGKLFICEACDLRVCTTCNVQYHDGLTCSMYASAKTDPGVTSWLRQDSANNKLCPKCAIPIQKNGGCLHVSCLSCKNHICWVCMDFFSTSGQCYGHLTAKHGGAV